MTNCVVCHTPPNLTWAVEYSYRIQLEAHGRMRCMSCGRTWLPHSKRYVKWPIRFGFWRGPSGAKLSPPTPYQLPFRNGWELHRADGFEQLRMGSVFRIWRFMVIFGEKD